MYSRLAPKLVTEGDSELLTLLPVLLGCWDCRYGQSRLVYARLEIKPRVYAC